MNQRRQSGFNLVELMVVVAIIGILSAVAVPRFATFKARAQQTEARSNLNGVFLAMQAYQSNYNTFPTVGTAANPTGAGIGFAMNGNVPKYSLLLISAANQWSAAGTSLVPLANSKYDVMRINANKWLCAMYDSVTQTAADAQPTLVTAADALDCPETNAGGAAAVASTLVASDIAN